MTEYHMPSVTEHHRKSPWLLISSMLLLAMGIFVIFNPPAALVASALLLGSVFALIGMGYLMVFRRNRSFIYAAVGVLDILIGLVLLFNLGAAAVSMPFVFGFWCLFSGVTYLAEGLRLLDSRLPLSGLSMITGVLGILFGVLVFLHPIFGTLSITFLLGAYLIIYSVCEFNRYMRQ